MKKIVLFVLTFCLCFTVIGGAALAETASAEATVTETTAAETAATMMSAEELYQAGKDAYDAGDYGKVLEYLQMEADSGKAYDYWQRAADQAPFLPTP